jgi:signal transduction histidine kinase
MGDANQLKQAFLNVINNAIQSMPDGGRIEISTEQAGHMIVVRVSDNGPGIPKEIMSKLFVPFFTTRKAGSGLGMAVTRRIVENHGGSIGVDSTQGEGTTVRISIPIVRSAPEVEHRALYGDSPEGGGVDEKARTSAVEPEAEMSVVEHEAAEDSGGSE